MSWVEITGWVTLAIAVWFLAGIPIAIVVSRRLQRQQPPPLESARDSQTMCDHRQ